MDPSKRFLTLILAAGVAVLLVAILVGEQMGSRVLVAAVNSGGAAETIVTPLPSDSTGNSSGPYGPDWKRSQTLSAAPDPGFPDPRVPPKPLPTPQKTPTPSPTPRPHDLPIWDQTFTPSPSPSGSESPSPSPSPSPT